MAENDGGGPGPRNAVQAHQSAVARFNHEPVDLDGTLDDLERVFQRVVVRLRDEVLDHEASKAGARNTALRPEFGKILKEATTALAAVVAARKSLWATAKERAGRMSPEERAEAMKLSVLKMPYLERRKFLRDLCARHTAQHRSAVAAGAEPTFGEVGGVGQLTMAEVG